MSTIPAELRYAKSHEWIRLAAGGTALVGITDYAQASLGDITFVQLPRVGSAIEAGATFGVVESVKAASDLYAPVGCVVLEVNAALDAAPEILNRDPYGEGWMLKVRLSEPVSDTLLDAAGYAAHVG